jgi:hypothetical protein
MSLPAVIDSLDSVDEKFRSEYKQIDGKFILDVVKTGDYELANVQATMSSLSAARKERDDAKKMLKQWEGLEPAAAREALKKLEEFSKLDPEAMARAKVEEFRTKIVGEHQTVVKGLNDKIAALTSNLSEQLITNSAQSAIAQFGGSKHAKLLLPHILGRTRLRETENGRHVVEVLDDAGGVQLGDANGTPMTIAQFVERMRGMPEYEVCFEGANRSGAGGPGNGRPPSSETRNGVRVIPASDTAACSAALNDIASGKAVVDPNK